MKHLASTLVAVSLLSAGLPASAGGLRFHGSDACYKEVYRERYISGTRWSPGYVRSWTERVRIPCFRRHRSVNPVPNRDDNSCVEGAVLGGIAGGGIGAVVSRGNGRLLGIPLGIVGGALLGCQIDGG